MTALTTQRAAARAVRRLAPPLGALAGLVGCGAPAAAVEIESLTVEVVRTLPHDDTAFTQGLAYLDTADGPRFLESTGLYGESTVRLVDVESGEVRHSSVLEGDEFGEGLAVVAGQVIQLTWKSGIAHVYDRHGLALVRSFRYEGEGWGLCWNGDLLIMSDGTSTLQLRRPSDFAVVKTIPVLLGETPLPRLNELECVGGFVYANVWGADQIVKIDPASGAVVAVADAAGLLSPEERRSADVLNGIAYSPSSNSFYLTGKLWPKVFEVRLVPGR